MHCEICDYSTHCKNHINYRNQEESDDACRGFEDVDYEYDEKDVFMLCLDCGKKITKEELELMPEDCNLCGCCFDKRMYNGGPL